MNPTTTLTESISQPGSTLVPGFALGRALWAETLKMKRTLALGLAFITPAVIVALITLMVLQKGQQMFEIGANPWLFLDRQTHMFWTLLMQPLFITLETALVAQLDHANDHWKHLFALPLPRWTIYIAKLIVNILLIALSLLILFVYTLIAGRILSLLRPEFGFSLEIPFQQMLPVTCMAFITSWIVISIHHFVALNWRSFVVASAFGIVMTIAGVLIISSDENSLYPWTLAAVATNSLAMGKPVEELLWMIAYSVAGGVIGAVAGCWLFVRKDVL
jgi:lantibiotic transport system permease protein